MTVDVPKPVIVPITEAISVSAPIARISMLIIVLQYMRLYSFSAVVVATSVTSTKINGLNKPYIRWSGLLEFITN